jgi:peptidoglycan-associated lipoprotein
MRRVLLLAMVAAGAAALAGCPSKPKQGECKTSQDCLEQQGFGKVCVEGRCQECGQDSDCRDGFVCRANKCVPKPQCTSDADCPAGQRCEADRCVARAEAAPDGAGRDAGQDRAAVPPECAETGAFTIRFGFDQSTLTGETQGTLQKLAECVKRAPAKRVTVQGHADDRGTTQYNIALGARRAESARKYLSDLGVGAKLEAVSFGEEKPLCPDQTEECWARNRRAEFQVDR